MNLMEFVNKYSGKFVEYHSYSAGAENQFDTHLVNKYNKLMVFIKGHIGYKSWLGKHLSKEHRKKLSLAHTGKKLSEEHKRKLIIMLTGRPVSKETRIKIGNANRGEKCGTWKGDKVKYRGLHTWVVRNWGKASMCQLCGATKNIDWHNINGQYKRNREDWEELCRKCHMDKDGRTKHDIR